MINIPLILAGLLLLFLGRRLFWLFVGLIGFVAGFTIAQRVFHTQPEWVTFAIALGVGLIGILVAIFLQRVAIALAGFFAGGYLGMAAAAQIGSTPASSEWMFYLVGAVIGAIILSLFFDWALVFLSSLSGAVLVTRGFTISNDLILIATAVLFALGFLVQAGWMRHHRVAASET